jgi:hypothetical protein
MPALSMLVATRSGSVSNLALVADPLRLKNKSMIYQVDTLQGIRLCLLQFHAWVNGFFFILLDTDQVLVDIESFLD